MHSLHSNILPPLDNSLSSSHGAAITESHLVISEPLSTSDDEEFIARLALPYGALVIQRLKS